MHAIEPDMVLGKEAVDDKGGVLGEIVDVGLYAHGRVKFLVVRGHVPPAPATGAGIRAGFRNVAVGDIAAVSSDTVRVFVS